METCHCDYETGMWLVTGWLVAALLLERHGRLVLREVGFPGEPWEAIVVAGCAVLPDGQPSRSLRRRTERAVELWRRGVAPLIVMTGGRGDDRPTEARAAALYARELGVPKDALLVEERSTTTDENARFAREQLAGGPIVVVTDTYHVFRCERVFSRYFSAVTSASTSSGSRSYGALREVAAVAAYAVTRRL